MTVQEMVPCPNLIPGEPHPRCQLCGGTGGITVDELNRLGRLAAPAPAPEWGAEPWGVHHTHCLYCRKPMAIVALVEHIANRTAEAYQEPEGRGPLCSDCKSPPAPEQDREGVGTCLTCRSFGGVGITSEDGEDVFGECGEGITQRNHGVWSNFGCRLYRSRLAAPETTDANVGLTPGERPTVAAPPSIRRGPPRSPHEAKPHG